MRAPSQRLIALFLLLATLLWAAVAHAAWVPPPLAGHVVDEAGALTEPQKRKLDKKLDRARLTSGFAIVVFILPKLPDGMTIEDVGYTAGNTWKVGSKKGDDGVILLASLEERKLRIETGKGVGGALTDVQSSHINREVIGPLMKEGRVYDAMNAGVDAILKELVEGTPGGTSDPGREREPGAKKQPRPPNAPMTIGDWAKIGGIALVILLVIIGAIVSPAFREILFWFLLFGMFRGRGGGGGYGGGGGDDDGGSGYGGGGGSFGGGGSSDDY
jgi:uncharacterized protein